MFSVNFFITALIVVLIPGTGAIYTINTGMVHKEKYSTAAAIGCTLGIVPHLVACIMGLSVIMSLSAKVFSIIKIIGAIYLGYLAFKTWKYAGQTEITGKSNEVSLIKTVQKGIVINLLNPKLTLFFLSFLPQFVPANIENKTNAMILLSLVFMGMTLIVFILYGLLASQASKIVKHNKRIMKTIERGFAIVFASLAIKLALEDK